MRHQAKQRGGQAGPAKRKSEGSCKRAGEQTTKRRCERLYAIIAAFTQQRDDSVVRFRPPARWHDTTIRIMHAGMQGQQTDS